MDYDESARIRFIGNLWHNVQSLDEVPTPLISSVWSDTLRPGGKKACPNLPLSPPQWTWPEVGGKEAPWMDGWGKRKGEDEVIEDRELCCCAVRHDTAFSMWGQIKCGVKWKVFTLYLHSPLSLLSKRLQIYVTVSLCLLPALIMPFLFFSCSFTVSTQFTPFWHLSLQMISIKPSGQFRPIHSRKYFSKV